MEWCTDYYAPYTADAKVDPVVTENYDDHYVVRGGGPDPEGMNLLSSCRIKRTPQLESYVGLRIVLPIVE